MLLWKDMLLDIREHLSSNGSLDQKPTAASLQTIASSKESEWHLAGEVGPWSVRTAKMIRVMSRHLQQAILKSNSTSSVPEWLEGFLLDSPASAGPATMKKPAAAPESAATLAAATPAAAKPAASTMKKPAAAKENVATLAAAAPAAAAPVAAAPAAAIWTFAYDENLQALLGRRFK